MSLTLLLLCSCGRKQTITESVEIDSKTEETKETEEGETTDKITIEEESGDDAASEEGAENTQQEYEPEWWEELEGGIYTCACDITHDGRNDILLVDYSDPILYMTNPMGLYLITEDGNAYRFGEIGIPHLGQGSYYLTNVDCEDYLLYYNPGMYTGELEYVYELLYLSEKGEKIVVDRATAFTEEEIPSFLEKLQPYLEDAKLLISTVEFELVVGEKVLMERYRE